MYVFLYGKYDYDMERNLVQLILQILKAIGKKQKINLTNIYIGHQKEILGLRCSKVEIIRNIHTYFLRYFLSNGISYQ